MADEGGQAAAVRPSEHYARRPQETTGSLFMDASMGATLHQIDPLAFRPFRDNLLIDCGNLSDLIVTMLIEQVSLAHPSIGRLHSGGPTPTPSRRRRSAGSRPSR